MRAQRSLTAFADPSRQLATFQRRSHRAASSFLRLIHIASLIKPDNRGNKVALEVRFPEKSWEFVLYGASKWSEVAQRSFGRRFQSPLT